MLLSILFFLFSAIYLQVIFISQNTTSSQLKTAFPLVTRPSSLFYIANNVTLTINDTLLLQNCEIVLGSNSRIIIEDDAMLHLKGSYLHGCDTMWDGIYVTGTAMIITESDSSKPSKIEDAMNGIVIAGLQAKMFVENTQFKRNHYSIRANYFGADSTKYNISACYFGMGSYTNFLPVPTGYTNYNKPIAGIELKFCRVDIPNAHYTGIANTFDRMNNGILSYWSETNIYDNFFTNIRNTETNPVQPGAAVYATGNNTWNPSSYLQVITATSAPVSNSEVHFRNCDYGVYANFSKLNIVNNRMDSVNHCIRTANSRWKVYANNNYLTNTNYGITLNNNIAAEQRVWKNTIHVNPPTVDYVPVSISIFGLQLNTYGIYQTEANNQVTANAHIDSNTIYNGRNCIWLNNVNGTQIYSNTVNQHSTVSVQGTQSGIYASNCRSLLVSGNTATGNGSLRCDETDVAPCDNSSPYRKNGFGFVSTTGQFCSNASDSIGYATFFASNCLDLNVRSNTYGKSKFGMVLKSSGSSVVLGNQGYDSIIAERHENQFTGDGTGSHNFANDSNFRTMSIINICDTCPNYIRPRFFYTGSDIPSNTEYTELSGAILNGVVANQFRIEAVPIDTNSTIISYQCTLPDTSSIEPWDLLIAGGNGENYMEEGYGETGNWLAKRKLFNKLRADTTLLNIDTLLLQFYDANKTGPIGQISDYEQQLLLLNDSAVLADTAAYIQFLDSAETLVRAISAGNAQEANFVAVNAVYIDRLYLLKDTFTTAQLITLNELAVQCPYVAGDAVYIARTLLAQVNDSLFFDDIELCTIVISGKKEKDESGNNKMQDTLPLLKEFVKVFPNPANDRLNVLFEAKVTGKAKFELMNIMGQTLKTVNIQDGANYLTFDVNDLPNAMYIWRLKDKSRAIGSGMVVIHR